MWHVLSTVAATQPGPLLHANCWVVQNCQLIRAKLRRVLPQSPTDTDGCALHKHHQDSCFPLDPKEQAVRPQAISSSNSVQQLTEEVLDSQKCLGPCITFIWTQNPVSDLKLRKSYLARPVYSRPTFSTLCGCGSSSTSKQTPYCLLFLRSSTAQYMLLQQVQSGRNEVAPALPGISLTQLSF